jgi:hypothetical protein
LSGLNVVESYSVKGYSTPCEGDLTSICLTMWGAMFISTTFPFFKSQALGIFDTPGWYFYFLSIFNEPSIPFKKIFLKLKHIKKNINITKPMALFSIEQLKKRIFEIIF